MHKQHMYTHNIYIQHNIHKHIHKATSTHLHTSHTIQYTRNTHKHNVPTAHTPHKHTRQHTHMYLQHNVHIPVQHTHSTYTRHTVQHPHMYTQHSDIYGVTHVDTHGVTQHGAYTRAAGAHTPVFWKHEETQNTSFPATSTGPFPGGATPSPKSGLQTHFPQELGREARAAWGPGGRGPSHGGGGAHPRGRSRGQGGRGYDGCEGASLCSSFQEHARLHRGGTCPKCPV